MEPGAAGDPAPDAKGYWPDDWRDKVSKGNEKVLQRLGRYASPEAALDALIEAQNRISQGKLKPGPKASAEEVSAWRAEMGIPESPDKYDLKGVQIPEASKPMFDVLFKEAHATGQSAEQVAGTIRAWQQVQVKAAEMRAENDRLAMQAVEDGLREEWGGEFRVHMNNIHGLLDGATDQGFKDKLLAARMPDGNPIGTSPEALKFLLSLALIKNPAGVVLPGGGSNPVDGVKEELGKLQKIPAAKKTEAQSGRQRQLIDAAIKMGAMDESGNWKS